MEDNLNLLLVGLDSSTIELIKSSFSENRIMYRLSYLQDVFEIKKFARDDVEAVFLFSNRQEYKAIEEVKKINQLLPRAAVVLLSPRGQSQLIIGAFRSGLFDFLTLPLDKNEIRTVLYRLKLHGITRHEHLSPERALLQYFARPENFTSVEDVFSSLTRYLETFLKKEREIVIKFKKDNFLPFAKKLKLTASQIKRIERFLKDNTGLIFGLRYVQNKFYFLIKSGTEEVSYLETTNISSFSIREVLNNYVANVLRTSLVILDENNQREQIKLLTLTDDVTGLFNQRKLIEDLDFFISRYPFDKFGFSLLFVDIDHFKNVNDQFGHVVGSKLLIDMAAIVKTQLRSSDLVYRYGGDEFIILLPKTEIDVAKKIAVRMSQAVKNAEFEVVTGHKYHLSLSIGIAGYPQDAMDAKAIIDFADKMMYLSKKSGRGKVFHINEVIAFK